MGSTIPRLISAADGGDPSAAEELFSVLYSELHRLARRELARHNPLPGLSPTTLLHEAYLELAAQAGAIFPDRSRFMSYAARVMRGLRTGRHHKERRELAAITKSLQPGGGFLQARRQSRQRAAGGNDVLLTANVAGGDLIVWKGLPSRDSVLAHLQSVS
jgi:DNA-directed RNA polymerase specialized sigma24 family protein